MPLKAKFYIGLIISLGLAAFVSGLFRWETSNAFQFVSYFLIAALASGLKVNLPAITGTMSVTSLFLLISIVQLSESETLLIGFTGTLIQCLWKPKSPIKAVRVAFSLAATCLAIAGSHRVFALPFPGSATDLDLLRVLTTACAFFVVNTFLVAAVIALTEEKRSVKRGLNAISGVSRIIWAAPELRGSRAS
jgi:hypothetical protein